MSDAQTLTAPAAAPQGLRRTPYRRLLKIASHHKIGAAAFGGVIIVCLLALTAPIIAPAIGGLPDGYVLATKLDREYDNGNKFDAAAMRKSLEESLEALGVDRIGLLHLHDPEYAADLDEVTKPGGGLSGPKRCAPVVSPTRPTRTPTP